MGNKANAVLGLVAVLATAFALNPNEESFKKYIDAKMKDTGSSWFERKLVSNISSLVYKREDYKFFSVINVPENETNYLGIFGLWIPLPTMNRLNDLKEDIERDLKSTGNDLKKQYKSVESDIKKRAGDLKKKAGEVQSDIKKRGGELADDLKKKGEELQENIKSE
ncbi:hypothetical protein BCR32DRAFT_271642 [Anaeromyces robustus]|jgi:ElaB/YqjD/DUF883 family membrane-anchored ribosome-binding protein|uniref:Uncharacterized protein n=1 Tax=Anaeromyces robustus TaxID=1754192 RepID=A0A1Y1WQP1_9FUNG|nr:hypothetical protein BCR32DRAFT_271642 [Anaeromyces robustus]|eukprot:ORX75840.1 hypothetical protein BCR32DRAFT_271642 [Anaeromyces robustus]